MNFKKRDFKKGSRDEVSSWLVIVGLQETKFYHGKSHFLPQEKFFSYLKKSSLEVGFHSPRHGYEST